MKLIVAVAKNWAIGFNGDLLFNLPDDMAFFKKTTVDKVVVMGRNTLLSFPGAKPLKNRTNIVLTTNREFEAEGCIICHSLDELFTELKKYNSDDIFVVGGGKIYNELYPYCSEALITKVDAIANADTFLHNFDEDENWYLSYASEVHEDNGLKFMFNTYKNKTIENYEFK
ncbi:MULTISPECIES: dihydrofolate reductase [unclassified Sedimentibacter]|uniref:dihydrofolate reductase n=1 Tax=unclassified Sedimentibacter TaxID=2649220 RepID=UPI0027E1E834|nr:dihydrofolate reductase [Sedimentibacter sp. MB35-C1]WMJ76563.1 dihydrofolate reductase [Sedimentibacter sp. MB35-C1]